MLNNSKIISIDHAREVAVAAAKKAGRFLMNSMEKIIIISGDTLTPTTQQDVEAQSLITKSIQLDFPDHDFLAEETKTHELINNVPYRWIIDPIDGTNNYIEGRDTFSVSIGLEYHGQIILGVVYLPKRDEMFVSEKDAGAMLNGKSIHAGNVSDLNQAVVTFSTYPGFEQNTEYLIPAITSYLPHLKRMGTEPGQTDSLFGRGSMAAEFCYLACGRIDGLMRFKQKPWDVAAGSLIAKEAGVEMFNLKGFEPNIYEGDYIAANPELSEKLKNVVIAQNTY